jgi:hypothetical protein
MTLDARFQPLATQLLQTYGRPVVFKSIRHGQYDTETGKVVARNDSVDIHTYLTSPDDKQLASGQYIASNLIAMISAEELGFEPKPNDKINIDDVDWTISRVSFVSSGLQNALYYCVLNK